MMRWKSTFIGMWVWGALFLGGCGLDPVQSKELVLPSAPSTPAEVPERGDESAQEGATQKPTDSATETEEGPGEVATPSEESDEDDGFFDDPEFDFPDLPTPGEGDDGEGNVGASNEDNRVRLAWLGDQARPHFGVPEVSVGFRMDGSDPGVAVRVSAELLRLENNSGDFSLIPFEAIYYPDQSAVRVRFSVADVKATYFCKDPEGERVAPLASLLASCQPEGYWGFGGELGSFQFDTDTNRRAARILALHAVLNFLGNSNASAYNGNREVNGNAYSLRRLYMTLGATWDHVWNVGNVAGAHGRQMALRGNLGMVGMLRSVNGKWEARAYVGYRPNLARFTSDFGVEAEVEGLYNHLFGDRLLGQFGIEANYTYWRDPAYSMGRYASQTQSNTLYLGAVFKMIFDRR